MQNLTITKLKVRW